jgi:hypothetical protein
MAEAREFQMPKQLRNLFATLLVFGDVANVHQLWNENFNAMAEDFVHKGIPEGQLQIQAVLQSLNLFLQNHAKSVSDYDLPKLLPDIHADELPRLILEELSYNITPEDLAKANTLNIAQRAVFEEVLKHISEKKGGVFFVDGPAGSGKTYLYDCLLSYVRSLNQIALAVASSGIAALLLRGGRTAHSHFKIPISMIDKNATCRIGNQTDLAKLLRQTTLIIWDEAPMTHQHAPEAVDKTLRDIMHNNLPFGGKIFLFGGDFRQVLPVIRKGTRTQIVNAALNKSYLWQHIQIFSLITNMRLAQAESYEAQAFAEYLLQIGNGTEQMIENELIRIPDHMVVQPQDSENPNDALIDVIYPNLLENAMNTTFIIERAILTPLNDDVDEINAQVMAKYPGEQQVYYSFDCVSDDTLNLYPIEYLNSITPQGLPPHQLTLKIGAPIMLLRNLDPINGLCNGTRLICRQFQDHTIDAEIITGDHRGKRMFIPRIPLLASEDAGLPFMLKRKQFPVRPAFALTINKSQGQTLPYVGLYLPRPVFSHGQLYVAMSRAKEQRNCKILVKNGKLQETDGIYTRNIVFKEALII